MRLIKVHLNIGLVGADRNDTLEVADDATEEEIEELAREWANDYIDWSWWEEPK